MLRGWLPLYTTSVRLGLADLLRCGPGREALVRVAVPLDPSRYLELPFVRDELDAKPGDRILDLASPKLLAVRLALDGVEVMSVDLLASEVGLWRRLAGGVPGLRFELADGRSLPFADGSFDGAYSVSVLEHVPDGGDEAALAELARVVRPGGRLVLTLPHAPKAREEWRERPLYGPQENRSGRFFFQRWYDDERLDALLASTPSLAVLRREVVRLQPNWNAAFNRLFPWLLPLGPFFGLLARERAGPGGDVARIALERS